MSRDSGGDVGESISELFLSGGYSLQWVMMCGYRVLKDGKPVTGFWHDDAGAAHIIIGLLEEK